MSSRSLQYGNRIVYVSRLTEEVPVPSGEAFAVLLPAYSNQEISVSLGQAATLLDRRCIEFCCVGSRAEELHDRLDEVIEDREEFDVVTTFHADIEEACEYFLFAAGAAEPQLLAMVLDHPEIEMQLNSVIKNSTPRR